MIPAYYEHRMARAVRALVEGDIDAWVVIGRETHILGEPALLHLIPVDMLFPFAMILTSSGERIALPSAIEAEEIRDTGLFTRVEPYRSLDDALAETLASLMPLPRIAVDTSPGDPCADGMTVTAYRMLWRALESAGFRGEIVSASPIMRMVRGAKSDEEVEGIRRAVDAAMGIYEAARPHMRVGMSGLDVQALFQRLIDEAGYGYSWHRKGNPFVSIGARSSYNCRTPPADVYIEPGDVVNVDLGVRVDGFASDNQRTFYAPRVGESEPPEDVARAFAALSRMNREVSAAMREGVPSDDLTAIGHRVMLESGYPDGWKGGYGHEIGLFAHVGGIKAGFTAMQPDLDRTLVRNMTFTLEPAILTPQGRVCQEEVVRVGVERGEMLSVPQREVWLIG